MLPPFLFQHSPDLSLKVGDRSLVGGVRSSATLFRDQPEVCRWICKELNNLFDFCPPPFQGPDDRFKLSIPLSRPLRDKKGRKAGRQALISTSTPEGRSSLDKASTVLEEDV
jgi:hypothetical protein